MAPNDNVTAVLYKRRVYRNPSESSGRPGERQMAFDPLLLFTAVLLGGAAISQLIFLLMLEF